jgi:CO/xanthine dehydrogenase Mo-binding subunit
VDDAEQFLEQYSKELHQHHYHLTTCKTNLMQMYGRTEGYLIQDMDAEQLARKKELCLEHLAILNIIDPAQIRLNIYAASAHFELHLPQLQVKTLPYYEADLTMPD